MKKSLLLLSLLIVANVLSQPKNNVANGVKKAKAVDKAVAVDTEEAIKEKEALQPKGQTTEDYLERNGGKVPHVPAHQGAESKCLHRATRTKGALQRTRAVSKTNRRVLNAAPAKVSVVKE
jgi:hypothetical protein